MLESYYDNVFDEKEQPLRLEEGFNVYIGDTVFAGKIDRIDLVKNNDGVEEVCIVDYKTGKEKEEKDIKDNLQLPLYALFTEEKLGLKVVKAKYIYVETGKELEVDVSQERREQAKEKLLDVLGSVRKGDFKATPGYICRFCDYSSICEYADL
jgi:CRISPR-associated protein Cas4